MRLVRCRFGLIPIGLVLAALWSPAHAQETVFQLDPANTEVAFTLTDPLHTVHGTFRLRNGTVRFNPSTGAAGGLVVVDATSGESGSGSRDRKMHKEVLESPKYSNITFTPVSFKGTLSPQGKSHLEVEGKLGLHGSEHPITLPFEVEGSGDPITAATHFVVPYVDWGLKNPSMLFLRVGPTVAIDIRAQGKLMPASAVQ